MLLEKKHEGERSKDRRNTIRRRTSTLKTRCADPNQGEKYVSDWFNPHYLGTVSAFGSSLKWCSFINCIGVYRLIFPKV